MKTKLTKAELMQNISLISRGKIKKIFLSIASGLGDRAGCNDFDAREATIMFRKFNSMKEREFNEWLQDKVAYG